MIQLEAAFVTDEVAPAEQKTTYIRNHISSVKLRLSNKDNGLPCGTSTCEIGSERNCPAN